MYFIKEISGYPINVLKKLYRHCGKKLSFDIQFSEAEDINCEDDSRNSLSIRAHYLEYLSNLGFIRGTRYNRYSATVQITHLGEQFVQTFLEPKFVGFFIKHIIFNNTDEIRCNQIKRFIKNSTLKSTTKGSLAVVHTMSETCNWILKKCSKHQAYKIKDCFDDLSNDDDRNEEINSLDDLGLISVAEHGDEIGDKHYYICSITPLGKLFLKKFPKVLHDKEVTANDLVGFYQHAMQLDLPDKQNDNLPIDMTGAQIDINNLCSYGHKYHHGV